MKELTLEELNLYIIGCRIREQREREREITQAYLTAQFAMSKKVKPLDHYLKESRKVNGYLVIDRTPVDVESSRKLAETIRRLNVKL